MLNSIREIILTGNDLYLPLLIFIFMDYITGVCVAIKQRKLSSRIGFRGLAQKALILLVVTLGWIIDRYILTVGAATESLVLLFYISNEGISILENLETLGVPIPERITTVLESLSKTSDSEETK